MFTVEESWKMTEPEMVLALVRDLGLWRLGNWDGCCCSSFSIRNVNIDISCGKGREQSVCMWSGSMDYGMSEQDGQKLLQPVMNEVVTQLAEFSGRGGEFKQYFHEWHK